MTLDTKLALLCVAPSQSLLEVMQQINRNARGIALVVDAAGHLFDTVTDGDLRRAVLDRVDLTQPVSVLRARRTSTPVTASHDTTQAQLIQLMKEHRLRHIPLLAADKTLAGLVAWDDFLQSGSQPPMSAVVMAGGLGSRLRPLTEDVPKPMLPIGDRPLMEQTIGRLRTAGIRRVYIATHYKPEAFTSHFGNGEAFGLDIQYLDEQQPLGTAGALAQMPTEQGPILVVNGDIVSQINYHAMRIFHEDNQATMTVGVRHYEFRVPYGVVVTEGAQISGVTEKPTQRFFVNAGIYLMQPEICRSVPPQQRFDMPELITTLLAAGQKVVAFPVNEYWLDIGDVENYEKAQADAKRGMGAS